MSDTLTADRLRVGYTPKAFRIVYPDGKTVTTPIIDSNNRRTSMFCTNCGKQIADDCNFCPYCGQKAKAPQPGTTTSDGIHIVEKKDPLFRIECEYCHCVFEYRSKHLGYRIWYPSGFVYCPSCRRPLRHHPQYEVKE